MNRLSLLTVITLSVLVICTSCNKEGEESTKSPYIEGLTIDSYPVIDGSTSTLPLNMVIACELMGLNYQWQEKTDANSKTWSMEPQVKEGLRKKMENVIKCSQTHNSIIHLMDGKADMVLSARTMSPDEKKYAEEKGVTLIETPIALDAFIFIVNPRNPVTALTTGNIQSIYTGKITDWRAFGVDFGVEIYDYSTIRPYIRNPNSGSQELMDLLVMKGLEYYTQLPIYNENFRVSSMVDLMDAVASYPSTIGYTVYYYNEQIIRPGSLLKTIGIDGVHPNQQTISDRSYPFATEVYAVIRSDTDKSSMAYKIYEWLQTKPGKQAISKSGYLLN